jgi:UDP-glucose 4-epimerase
MTDYGLYDSNVHRVRVERRLLLMEGIAVHRVDLRDHSSVEKLMRDFRPDCLVHLANLPVASLAEQKPSYASEVIVGGTITLLEMARKFGLGRFVYVSSSMVYGHCESEPIDEEQPCWPVEPYGALKLSCEQLVRGYSKSHDFQHVIVRPSAVYGPSGNETFVISRFLAAARGSGVIRVFGRDTKLDFTFIDDVVSGILLTVVSEKARGETFNVARGEARTLIEAAQWVAARVPGCRVSIEPPDLKASRRGTMGIAKARALLGFDPRVSLEMGLDVVLDHESRSFPEA